MTRATYDFETTRRGRPILLGLMWGEPGAREYASHYSLESPREVVRWGLESMRLLTKFDGVTQWWAHNGGNFDSLILLETAERMGWKVDASVAQGGRVIRMILKPCKGEQLELLDSFAVVPSKLADACKDFDLCARKLFTAQEYKGDMSRLSRARLDLGCRADCEAVAELLDVLESYLSDWGGRLKATFSSSALTCAKAAAKEAVGDWPETSPLVNKFSERGRYGGRVEVFHHSPVGELREYDVTSSYPWSVSLALPWVFSHRDDAPKDLNFEGMVEADVDTPPMWLPVLPVKDEAEGLYFPTGKWRGVYPACELRYAQTQGVKVRPLTAYVFHTAQPFAAFIHRAFTMKNTSTGAAREFAKYALNGAIGKLQEKPEKEKLYVFPDDATAEAVWEKALAKQGTVRFLSSKHRRYQVHNVFHWPKHTNFAAGAYVMAYSRILLHRHLLAAGPGLAYCDTDSIHTPATAELDARVNSELGGLKVEVARLSAEYYAPKLYRLRDLDRGKTYLASKGFPVDAAQFARIVAGERVFRQSFTKIKTQLGRHRNHFKRINVPRAWAGMSAKRFPFADGSTRPWTIEEIRAGAHTLARSPLAKFSTKTKKARHG